MHVFQFQENAKHLLFRDLHKTRPPRRHVLYIHIYIYMYIYSFGFLKLGGTIWGSSLTGSRNIVFGGLYWFPNFGNVKYQPCAWPHFYPNIDHWAISTAGLRLMRMACRDKRARWGGLCCSCSSLFVSVSVALSHTLTFTFSLSLY